MSESKDAALSPRALFQTVNGMEWRSLCRGTHFTHLFISILDVSELKIPIGLIVIVDLVRLRLNLALCYLVIV